VFGLLLAGAFSAGLVGSFPQNALDHLQVALLEASVLQTQWGDDYIISSLPGFGSSLSSPSGDGCNYQGCYDSSGSEATDVKRVSRPINLILCRLRSTPLYAKIVLFGTLGLVAGIWINIGLRRCFLKQSGGRRLLVGSFLVYLITIGWVFLIG